MPRSQRAALAAVTSVPVTGASGYRESMPAGDATMDGQLHDLYAQAEATRKQSRLLAGELRASRRRTSESWQLIQAAWDNAEQIRARRLAARPDRLRHSAYARLQAQRASMPVIEQAKGVLMAKYGWSEDQAFDALRRASQRENIKVRELAVRIMAGTAGVAPAPRTAGVAPAPRTAGVAPAPRTAGVARAPRGVRPVAAAHAGGRPAPPG
jgi:ANTAR domain